MNLWPRGLTPYPFQLDAVEFAMKRLRKDLAAYLALEPGLGKTICAAIILNQLNQERPTIAFYVCPPFLTSNTASEFDKWAFDSDLFLHLLPDSRIATKRKRGQKKNPDETSVLVDAMVEKLKDWEGDRVLFVDEAHRFKNETTGRAKALFKQIVPHFKKVVYLSGTPLPNSRAKELWATLKTSAKDTFGTNFFPYGVKYCGGFRTNFGWDFDGFTNRAEYRARLTRTFMIRVKKDVLDLPPKREGLLTVGEGLPPVISKIEKEILKKYSVQDLMEKQMSVEHGLTGLHMATYFRLLGDHKVKHSIPVIEDLLETTKDNVLIFAVHKETIEKLRYALSGYSPLVITGSTAMAERPRLVKLFQESKKHRVFLLNIQAGGIGNTLTKANRVLFVEFLWVDGDNTQAADRAHRIGQKNSVLVQYVVLKDSLDRKRMEVLLNKRKLAI